ncbi:ribbon-helix-helix protein, CopG family [Nostoc sp. NZL]|uniref:ribbon-helix-helix protein, CopG family n=1 Tax=Nostoc sp. NZL TaxID=2650612 RepID=UPI0018C5DABF|nr:ribbon-helix-helix protein, CopG family [Nostoc sp. NZL]MBG1240366.1 ribbon-helix-helix protein, CopG family [Nostoc sp. NZL]
MTTNTRVSVRLDIDSYEWVTELSETTGESVSTVLRTAIREARLNTKKTLRNNKNV